MNKGHRMTVNFQEADDSEFSVGEEHGMTMKISRDEGHGMLICLSNNFPMQYPGQNKQILGNFLSPSLIKKVQASTASMAEQTLSKQNQ